MGGVRNFTYFAAEATLIFLSKRQVGLWFIVDRDERDEAEIAKLQQLVGGKACIHVLEKREIENYMVSPRALLTFINRKKTAMGAPSKGAELTESMVVAALDKAAENLKQVTIAKRVARLVCRPAYPDIKHLFDNIQGPETADKISGEIQRLVDSLIQNKSDVQRIYEEQVKEVEKLWASSKFTDSAG